MSKLQMICRCHELDGIIRALVNSYLFERAYECAKELDELTVKITEASRE